LDSILHNSSINYNNDFLKKIVSMFLFLLRNATEREQRKKTKMIYKANINELNARPLE